MVKGPEKVLSHGEPSGTQPDHIRSVRTLLLRHTVISVAINAFIPTTAIWALGLTPPATVFGRDSIVPSMVLASGLATFLMTPAVTLITRMELRSSCVRWRRVSALRLLIVILPRQLLARALTLAGISVLILVPCFLMTIAALPIMPLTSFGFVTWNVLYGAAVGATMTPMVVLRALGDIPGLTKPTPSATGDRTP